jgi:hypothetical protein
MVRGLRTVSQVLVTVPAKTTVSAGAKGVAA